jgi:hypothetical protein
MGKHAGASAWQGGRIILITQWCLIFCQGKWAVRLADIRSEGTPAVSKLPEKYSGNRNKLSGGCSVGEPDNQLLYQSFQRGGAGLG